MLPFATLAAGTSAISSLASLGAGRKNDRATRANLYAQARLARQQADQGKALFDRYTSDYAPLEGEYIAAVRAGAHPDYIYEANRARRTVGRTYDAEGARMRNEMARLGIDPSSPRYQSLMRSLSLRRAADTAGAVNTARIGERDRARTEGFNRLGAGVTMGRGLLSPAISSTSGAASTYGNVANAFAGRTQNAMEDAGAGLQSAFYWGNRAFGGTGGLGAGLGGGETPSFNLDFSGLNIGGQ